MKIETLQPSETIVLIPKHSQKEYPDQNVPVVVLRGYSDRYTSEVKEIFRGPLFGGNIAGSTGCASAGYIAMAIKDKTAGNVYSWLTKAIESQDKDGLAAEAEAINAINSLSFGKIGYLFTGYAAQCLKNICKEFLAAGVIARVRDNFRDKTGLKRLEDSVTVIANASLD